jgi:hypothetical protein
MSFLQNIGVMTKKNIEDSIKVKDGFVNSKTGINSVIAGGHFYGLMFLFFLGVSNLVLSFIVGKFPLSKSYFIFLGAISCIVAYFLTDYKDRYLLYFKEFDNLSKGKRRKWGWISFFIYIGLWIFGIGSLLLTF